jgi:hypothetical protein
MKPVFADTFYFLALLNERDAAHARAGLQTVVRALQWLANRPVTYPIPADFPTADKVSIRGEITLLPDAQ